MPAWLRYDREVDRIEPLKILAMADGTVGTHHEYRANVAP